MNYNNGNYGGMPFSYQTPYYGNMYGQGQQYNRQQPMQQPQMVQPQQPMQYEMPIQYVGYGTLKEAEAYILMPNAKAIFIDKTNGMYYEKASNNEGQSFIKQFKEISPKDENNGVEAQKPQDTIDYSSFAKKEDLGKFVSLEELNKLWHKIQQLENQIGGKQNVRTKQ